MKIWVLYAVAASAAFGLSAIPLKCAVSRGSSSELSLISSCLGAFIGATIYLTFSEKSTSAFSAINKNLIFLSGLSGIISVAGSLAVENGEFMGEMSGRILAR